MTEFERMIQLLDTSWLLRDEIVPCLVGPPGIGKTAAVELHAKNHNCGKVVKIVASRCVPSETVGMTMPDHANRSMDIYNSMQLSSLEDGDILFLDELLEADQFVLSTLLTVIESREMADGTPLPDIQIIAATNDTIPSDQLKDNIKERFMFMRFEIDKEQTKKYILEKTGMEMPRDILNMLTGTSREYNFLTPRTLTKLCLWIDATPEDKVTDVSNTINQMFGTIVGTALLTARKNRDSKIDSPEQQIRTVLTNMSKDGYDIPDFQDCTFAEMLSTLQSLSDWERIKEVLSNIEIKVCKEDDIEIEF